MRLIVALVAGGLFGAGLLISGMTDTLKVQGWLDVFGHWDATLAFVFGGALIPMAIAWRVAARRKLSYLGLPLPAPPRTDAALGLIAGSILFGMGWALAGLCPGPALASISFGGSGGLVFLLAMTAGMLMAPPLAARIDGAAPNPARTIMDIRPLTDTYAVSPQIDASDLATLKAKGYSTVIDNRPDREIPEDLQTEVMRKAALAAGLTFVANPLIPGNFTPENIALQAEALASAPGKVLAYCASGNRCSVVWAMMNAGKHPTDELIAIPARHGYNLEPLRPQIDALAAK